MKKFFHKLLGTGFALLLMVGAIFAMSLSANAATTSVSIGGVTLNSGEYLPTGQTTKTTTKPSGGYAYFNNGVLTLHNYELNTVKEIKTVVEGALTLTLSGTSTVTYTGSSSALYVGGNLTVSGNGKLIINATAEKYSDGIFCSGGMIFQSGTMEVKANDDAIYAQGLELKSGTITVNSERIGVRLQKDSTFSGGKLIVNAKDNGIQNTGNLDICGTDVTITAGVYGIKVDQYISKVTIRGASDVRIDSKHTGILCNDIIVTDLDAKVVISGESKAAVEFFSKQFDSDLAITVSNTADGSEATNYYGTLGGYKYLYLRMPDLYVCGVPMALGDYYRGSCSAATTYAYSYGYARAQLNGERTELTLYRFTNGGNGDTPAIHSPGSLLLILDGDNYISSENAPTIKLDNGSMEVLSRSSTDEGRLFITAKGSDGIQLSKGSYYQTSGIINITAQVAGVNVYDKEVSVTGGKLDVVGNARALSCGKITYHNLQIKATQAASGALGNYSGSYMNKYKHIVIADHFCTGVLHPAKESSCTTAGKQAYYECSCGRYYEDAACLVEIGTLYLWGVIPETGHTPKDGWAVNEISHYKVCKVCNAQINDTGGLHYGGKATCQQKANCTICGTAYGSLGNHSWSKTWDHTDEKGRYHRCTTPGCGELSPVEAHAPGWLNLGDIWYYLKPNGERTTGWLAYGPVWYYFTADGVMYENEWLYYGNVWYYFNYLGRMVVNNWAQDGDNWYYFDGSGHMVTGVYTIGGVKHQFSASGVWQGEVQSQKTGWVQESGKWYYYQNGVKKTGWLLYGKDWYYLKPDGSMQTGWLLYGSVWYYFDANGVMATGSKTIGGKVYHFDANGVCQNP